MRISQPPAPPPPPAQEEPKWTRKKGYWVDARDPDKIVVKVQIFLDGDPASAALIRALEKPAEAVLARDDFTVDIELVNKRSRHAHKVKLSDGWNTSGNFNASTLDATGLAHEVGHMLGLPDTYDYRVHCGNKEMGFVQRNFWCALGHVKDVEGEDDLMGNGTKLTREQVEKIAGVTRATKPGRP